MHAYCSLDPCEQISVKFQLNYIVFIEIIFQIIVRKMVAILSLIDMGILTLLFGSVVANF